MSVGDETKLTTEQVAEWDAIGVQKDSVAEVIDAAIEAGVNRQMQANTRLRRLFDKIAEGMGTTVQDIQKQGKRLKLRRDGPDTAVAVLEDLPKVERGR